MKRRTRKEFHRQVIYLLFQVTGSDVVVFDPQFRHDVAKYTASSLIHLRLCCSLRITTIVILKLFSDHFCNLARCQCLMHDKLLNSIIKMHSFVSFILHMIVMIVLNDFVYFCALLSHFIPAF